MLFRIVAKEKADKIPSTIHTMVVVGISLSAGSIFKPSIAEVIVMGGVIMPSAISAAPPIMAGITSHFRRRLTRA